MAKSTHSGLPWLRFLRQKVTRPVHFWPFDGWEIPAGDDGIVVVEMAQQHEFQGDGGEPPYNTEADLAVGLAASSRRKRGD